MMSDGSSLGRRINMSIIAIHGWGTNPYVQLPRGGIRQQYPILSELIKKQEKNTNGRTSFNRR
jgi:hypothetical protein